MHPNDAPHATPDQCLHEILDVVTSLRNGHFTGRLNEEMPGDAGEIAKVVNELLVMLVGYRAEHLRLMEELGVTGRLGGQMEVQGATGAWREMTDAVNHLGVAMTEQLRGINNVVREHLRGETRSRVVASNTMGEVRELRELLNALLDRAAATKAPG